MRLEGKVAIITGVGHGLGKAGAQIFAREGAKVVGCSYTDETGEATMRQIREEGGDGVYIHCDVSKSAEVREMIDFAVRTYGKIDILYNNAGRGFGGPVTDLDEDTWDRAMDTNLKSVYLTCKYAIPELIKQPTSVIINTSSIASLAARTLLAAELHAYAATKGGINSLSLWLAAKYGPKGVRVNVIAPGNMAAGMGERLQGNTEVLNALADVTPLRRCGSAEDIAYAALFLASDEAAYISGVVLPVDGGFIASRGTKHE
jgi:NAD(P)-dependent dehydrogenase (short-subunit alcohol dehydrogenase family)